MNRSRRERVLTTAIAAALALVPAWFMATQLDSLLVPTDRDIAEERQRQQAVAAVRRSSGDTLDPAGRPLMDGVAQGGAAASSTPKMRDFPGTDTVDYEHGDYSHGTTKLEVRDATDNGMDKVVRLRSAATQATVATLYVPAGKSSRTEVPSGPYLMTIAEGFLWYGRTVQCCRSS